MRLFCSDTSLSIDGPGGLARPLLRFFDELSARLRWLAQSGHRCGGQRSWLKDEPTARWAHIENAPSRAAGL
jgi:hypothetical protein